MGNALVELLAGAAATGNWMKWPGGSGCFMADATNFSGATVKLQVKSPAGNAVDAGVGTTFTAADAGLFDLPPCLIRAAITGGPPTGVTATASVVSKC